MIDESREEFIDRIVKEEILSEKQITFRTGESYDDVEDSAFYA